VLDWVLGTPVVPGVLSVPPVQRNTGRLEVLAVSAQDEGKQNSEPEASRSVEAQEKGEELNWLLVVEVKKVEVQFSMLLLVLLAVVNGVRLVSGNSEGGALVPQFSSLGLNEAKTGALDALTVVVVGDWIAATVEHGGASEVLERPKVPGDKSG